MKQTVNIGYYVKTTFAMVTNILLTGSSLMEEGACPSGLAV